MKSDPSHANEPDRFLRMSLRANAFFSTFSGLAFVFASGRIADFLGDLPASLVLGVGVQLLVFAAALAWLSSQMNISTALTLAVIAADCLWVFATGVVGYADLFTQGGDILLVAPADVVLVLAILQSMGVRRLSVGLLGVGRPSSLSPRSGRRIR